MRIALVGNQNSGKSTLFNTLTNMNQKIGNWPGVTVEKKIGLIKKSQDEIVDLPGIYSLHPYTEEEAITKDFLLHQHYDVIINIIDCQVIERSLYLTLELLKLFPNVIIVLNMYDLAEKKGIFIESQKLSQYLQNKPVIKVSAINGEGTKALLQEIAHIHTQNHIIEKTNKKQLNNYQDTQNENEIALRYQEIDTLLSVCLKKKTKKSNQTFLDALFLHPYLAIPSFVIIIATMYFLAIDIIGNHCNQLTNQIIQWLTNQIVFFLQKEQISPILISLLQDGIFPGIGTILSFLPQLFTVYTVTSFLEKSGYMARITLIFHRILKKLGLSGNSVIPLILGTRL